MDSSSTAPWADTPFALIPTPGRGEKLSTLSTAVFMAREMANAHNAMLRSLNSIYQQCIFVTEAKDVQDLLLYATFWCDWIHEHHDGEENFLFPRVEKIAGVKGLMDGNIEQHRAFMGGLESLRTYAKETKVEEFNGVNMRSIITGFGGKLTTHLTEEIGVLLELKKYDATQLRKAWTEFDEEMRKGDKSILFPIVFGSHDKSYEDGVDWPEVPGPIRAVVHYWFERKYQGAWRFSPSTTWGERRPLMFAEKHS